TSSTGISYYYAVAQYTQKGCILGTYRVYSGSVEVYSTPTISSSSLSNANYCKGNLNERASSALTINGTNGGYGTLTFNWYKSVNTVIGDGDELQTNQNTSAFAPFIDSAVSRYYFAILNNGGPATCNVFTSGISGLIGVFEAPTISTQPVGANYCSNTGTIASLQVAATATNLVGANLSYRWYRNGVLIPSVNSNNYTPSIVGNLQIGALTNIYYVVPNLGLGSIFSCDSIKSNNATINVYRKPSFSGSPNISLSGTFSGAAKNYCVGSIFVDSLAVITTPLSNDPLLNLTYSWDSLNLNQMNPGTLSGEVNSSFKPPVNQPRTNYFRVVVKNGSSAAGLIGCEDTSMLSRQIIIISAPTIATQGQFNSSVNYCDNVLPNALNVIYTGPTLPTTAIKWYQTASASTTGGGVVNTTVGVSPNSPLGFTPLTQYITSYYRAVVYGIGTPGCPDSVVSNPSGAITIYQKPTLITTPSGVNYNFNNQSYCQNAVADILRVGSTVRTGNNNASITYRWVNASNFNQVQTDSFYSPATANIGSINYRVIVQNAIMNCADTSTNSVTINVVNQPALVLGGTGTNSVNYCFNSFTNPQIQEITISDMNSLNRPTVKLNVWYRDNDLTTSNGGFVQQGNSSTNYQALTPKYDTTGRFYYFSITTYNEKGCNASGTSQFSGAINVYKTPIISTINLNSAKYCLSGVANTPAPVSLRISVNNEYGNRTYTWYKSLDNTKGGSDDILLTATNDSAYAPTIDSANTRYYYMIVSNGGPAFCSSATSDLSGYIAVYSAPTITTNPISSANYCSDTNSIQSLNVAATAVNTFSTNISYQWYKYRGTGVTNTSLDTLLNAATNQSLTLTKAAAVGANIGDVYSGRANSYYAIASLNNGLVCDIITSNVGTINMYSLPVVGTNISLSGTWSGGTRFYCGGSNSDSLAIIAVPLGNQSIVNLTYRWFQLNSLQTGDSSFGSLPANQNYYYPQTSQVRDNYYYAYIKNGPSNLPGCETRIINSRLISVINAPTISMQPSTASATYCSNITPNQLSITYIGPGVLPQVQWFVDNNNDNAQFGNFVTGTSMNISANVATNYTPSVSNFRTVYYRALVRNIGTTGCPDTIWSNKSGAIVVYQVPSLISSQINATYNYCQNASAVVLRASSTVRNGNNNANITYIWKNVATGNVLSNVSPDSAYTPLTNVVGTISYRVVVQNGIPSCVDSSISANTTITVTNQPNLVLTNSGAQKYCANNSTVTNIVISDNSVVKPTLNTLNWYFDTTGSGFNGTIYSSPNSYSDFTPPITTTGRRNYYAIATYNQSGCVSTTTAYTGAIEVYNTPNISAITPTILIYCKGSNGQQGNSPITTTFGNGGYGTLSYSWNKSYDGTLTNANTLNLTNTSSYLPLIDSATNRYYYVTINNGGPANCNTATSNVVGPIRVYSAPVITNISFSDTSYCSVDNFKPLSINVVAENTQGGVSIAYQWYRNPVKSTSNGNRLNGATNNSLTLDGAGFSNITNGINNNYYVVAYLRNLGLSCDSTFTSTAVTIRVLAKPLIRLVNASAQTYCQGNTAVTINVVDTPYTNNQLTYQWFKSYDNATGNDSLLPVSTSSSFVPPTDSLTTRFYYTIVYNAVGNTPPLPSCVTTSVLSGGISVISSPTLTALPSGGSGVNYCSQGSARSTFIVNYSGPIGSSAKYFWYQSTSSDPNVNGMLVQTDSGISTSSYLPIITSANTYYYKVVAQLFGLGSSGCPANISSNKSYAVNIFTLPVLRSYNLRNNTYCRYTNSNFVNNLVVSDTGARQAGGTNYNVNYNWYRSTTNQYSDGGVISSATDTFYKPNVDTIGTRWYYVVATNGGLAVCAATSAILSAQIIVNDTPSLAGSSLNGNTFCLNAAIDPSNRFIATVSPANFDSIRWFRGFTNTGYNGSRVSAGSTLDPIVNTTGRSYYYFTVNFNSAIGCDRTSDYSGAIDVYARPVVTPNAIFANIARYCIGAANSTAPTPLVTTGNAGGFGTLSYTWYKSYDNVYGNDDIVASGPTITGSYNPRIDSAVSRNYYVVASNGSGLASCDTGRSPISGRINTYSAPTISTQPVMLNGILNYCSSETIQSLNINSNAINLTDVIGGTVSYRWYKNTTNSLFTGTPISGADGEGTTFSPNLTNYVTNAATNYFYAVAYLNIGAGLTSCDSTRSNLVTMNLYVVPSITDPSGANIVYCQNANPNDVSTLRTVVTVNPAGGNQSLTYRWFRNLTTPTQMNNVLQPQTSDSLKPNTGTLNDTSTYYVVVYNNIAKCADTSANSGKIIITALPAVGTIDNTPYTYCRATTVDQITPIKTPNFSGAGSLTVNWYDSNGITRVASTTPLGISGALTPPTNNVGIRFYRVVVNIAGITGCPTNTISSNYSGAITIVGKPTLSGYTWPAASYCQSTIPGMLTVGIYSNGGVGDSIWSWYRTASSNVQPNLAMAIANATKITNENRGETSNSLLPRTTVIDTVRYFAILSNGFGSSASLVSCSADTTALSGNITINPIPVITTPLRTADTFLCVGSPISLNIVGSANGTLTYKWFVIRTRPGNIKDTIKNLTEPTNMFTQAANLYSPGDTINYYVVITLAGQCGTTSPLSGKIIIVGNPIPGSIVTNNARYCENNVGNYIRLSGQSIGFSGGGLQYSWFISTTGTPGTFTRIPGEASDSLRPITSNVGTQYYQVVVTQNNGGCTATSIVSDPVVVNKSPVISFITSNLIFQCQSASLVSTDSFKATINRGASTILSYQWYTSKTNNASEAFVPVTSGTNYTQTRVTDTSIYFLPNRLISFDTQYFRIIATDDNTCKGTSTFSGRYVVLGNPNIISYVLTGDTAYCKNQSTGIGTYTINGSGSGTLSYRWYKTLSVIDSGTNITNAGNANGNGANNGQSIASILVNKSDSSYYYVIVTQTLGGCFLKSPLSKLILVYGQPSISINQSTAIDYCQFQIPTPITSTVDFTQGRVGRITYQWFDNGNSSVINPATAITLSGQTLSAYTPSTLVPFTKYFYIAINNGGPAGCNTATSAISPVVTVVARPNIRADGQPNTNALNLCQRTQNTVLRVGGNANNGNNLSFRWYSTKTGQRNNATEILNSNDSIFRIPTSIIDTNQYFVIIDNASSASCRYDTSNFSGFIYIKSSPTITATNQNATYCKNAFATSLNVSAIPGTLSLGLTPNITGFVWYRNVVNNRYNPTPVIVRNNPTTLTADNYQPSTMIADTFYYYAIVSNSNSCNDTSMIFSTILVNTKPSSRQPKSSIYKYCQTPTSINSMLVYDTISVSDITQSEYVPNNNLSYAWYKSPTQNYNGTLIGNITNETNNTVTKNLTQQFNLNIADSFYYYLVSTNSNNCSDTTMFSPYFEVASRPMIVNTTSILTPRRYCYVVGSSSDLLTIQRNAGTIPTAYQWYKNTANSNTGGMTVGPNTSGALSYLPPLNNQTNNNGVLFYYVRYNYGTANCFDSTNIIASDTVFSLPSIVTQPNPTNVSYCTNMNQSTLNVVVNALGGIGQPLTYQWFLDSGGNISAISGQTSSSYTPPNNNPIGVYRYFARISNGSGLGSCQVSTSDYSGYDTVYSAPTIILQPVSSNLCRDSSVANLLRVTVNPNKPGNPVFYQWYSTANPSDNTNGSAIIGATQTSYTPNTSTVSKAYYYVVITNGGPNSSCNTVRSSQGVAVTVNALPIITTVGTFNQTQIYCQNLANQVKALNVNANPGAAAGTDPTPAISRFIWYNITSGTINRDQSITPLQSGAIVADSVFPNNATIGTFTYNVVVFNNVGCRATSSTSGNITIQPRPDTSNSMNLGIKRVYCLNTPNSAITPLSIPVVSGFSYQWYYKTVNNGIASGGISVNDSIRNIIYPPSNVRGVYFYYLEISNNGCTNTSRLSDSIRITSPTITAQPNSARVTISLGNTFIPIGVTVTETSVKYQWYRNIDSNRFGVGVNIINDSVRSAIVPFSNTDGINYYFVVVRDTTTTCVVTSDLSGARIVQAPPTITNITPTRSEICKNTNVNITVTASNNGSGFSLEYRWYKCIGLTPNYIDTQFVSNAGFTLTLTSTDLPVAGAYYYFVRVINRGTGLGVNSLIDTVNVYAAPFINAGSYSSNYGQLANYCLATSTANISALTIRNSIESNFGMIKNHWFKTATNSVGTGYELTLSTSPAIQGNLRDSSITPAVDSVRGFYYYQVIENTLAPSACRFTTSVISGLIQTFASPIISTQPSSTDVLYCINGISTNLSVQDSIINNVGLTNRTYTWYRGKLPNFNTGNFVSIANSNNRLYQPSTSLADSNYYYVVINNSGPTGCNVVTSQISGKIAVYDIPVINTNLNSNNAQNYCVNSTANNLTTIASLAGSVGTLSYSWYKTNGTQATPNNGWLVVNGNNNGFIIDPTTLRPSTDTARTERYYVVFDNGFGPMASCRYSTSALSGVISVYNKPVINSQISTTPFNYCLGATATELIVNASLAGGVGTTVSYQWYRISNLANYRDTSKGVIPNEITSNYRPSTTTADSSYYYVVINNRSGLAACDTSVSLLSGKISVFNNPSIIMDINNRDTSYCVNGTIDVITQPTNLTINVVAPGNIGSLTYKWYKTTSRVNNGGSLYGAAAPSQQPDYSTTQASFYYVVVDNNTPAVGSCRYSTSRVSGRISIFAKPVITNNLNYIGYPAQKSYCQGQLADTIFVTGNTGGLGTLSYQWYGNASNSNATGSLFVESSNNYYLPITNRDTSLYYYAILFNGGPAGCDTTRSRTSGQVTVNTGASIVYGSTFLTARNYCENNGGAGTLPIDLTITTRPGATATYQWFYSPTSATTGGTAFTAPLSTYIFSPPTDSINLGTRYYYLIISVTYNSTTCITPTQDPTGAITVFALPRITLQPSQRDTSYCQNASNQQNLVTAGFIPSNSAGAVNNQWYSNSTNSTTGGMPISGAITNSRAPLVNLAGFYYYYNINSNSSFPSCQTTSNLSGRISIYGNPIINNNISNTLSYDYCKAVVDGSIFPIQFTASLLNNVGNLTYKWYKKTISSPTSYDGWQVINGNNNGNILPNDTSLKPSVDSNFTRRYYVVIDNNFNGIGACRYTTSNISGEIRTYSPPTITSQNFSPSADTFYITNQPAKPFVLTPSLNGGPGTINYTWYKNTLQNAVTPTPTQVASGNFAASYTPLTNVSDSSYYFVVVDNSFPITGIGNGCKNAAPSFTGKVIVYNRTTITTINLRDTNYCVSTPMNMRRALQVSATTSGGLGLLTYQWYRNSTNSTT
ncbi:MAG: hypothetical protein ORN85_00930, partial [Sediminibacterium sp.]|nr:hypothetical protein [Sediminibacterium sp.]